jgi:hypothetical protein
VWFWETLAIGATGLEDLCPLPPAKQNPFFFGWCWVLNPSAVPLSYTFSALQILLDYKSKSHHKEFRIFFLSHKKSLTARHSGMYLPDTWEAEPGNIGRPYLKKGKEKLSLIMKDNGKPSLKFELSRSLKRKQFVMHRLSS